MTAEFVHLHVHTQYSMLNGAIRLKDLVARTEQLGMSAVAVTDHGNMFGAVQLHKSCGGGALKPILGCEVSVVDGSRHDPQARRADHLVLLASNQQGYENIVRIVSQGWVDGMHRGRPRVDLELIAQHRQGVIGLSACMAGVLPQTVLLEGPEAGREKCGELKSVFEPGSFFIELEDHDFPEQRPLNEILVSLAKDHDLPLVATNCAHYLSREDARAQMVLMCIGASRSLEDMERTHHRSEELYLKSPEEMAHRFRHLPEAVKNTLAIAERCAGQVDPLSKPKLPAFSVPEGVTEEDFLREIAARGLDERLEEARALGATPNEKEYRDRLQIELDVINSMGFPGYFLIVQDFINWGKQNGVPVGPGRGSGAGSLVAYALRITNLDPLPYGLLFERFLNPERVSMPDFDVDFCMEKRDRVIDYVREKYGRQSVGQIATFHLLKSRSVVRDVGRVLGFSPGDAGRIATLVPEPVGGKSVPIDRALEEEPRLKAIYDEDPRVRELLDTAMSLENLTRHAGMHAAGVVISEGPLWDHVPVFCPEEGVFVTQYDKDDVEAAGLVKFDFLGLKTLTVLDIAVELIRKRPGQEGRFDLDAVPMDDPATFALLQSGETTNVFQLESSGMQGLFKKLKPDCFEDIVAAVALYRPGPLGSGMVDDFVERKHGRTRVEYPHPSLEDVLKDTYGVIVYQEQVMSIAREMAGYSLGGADLLRRAMGKKKESEMVKQKAIFLEGAEKKGFSREDADRVFELMAYFAGYGFNKSHSAAYALITYQTAYLKAHFPVEFVAATLSADKDKTEKVVRTVAEARSMGITVLPPDVNDSEIDFTVVYEPPQQPVKRPKKKPVCAGGKLRDPTGPKIRFGLGGVRGCGGSALEAIFEARSDPGDGSEPAPGEKTPFTDVFDFAGRVDLRRVNKNVIEALVLSGAFDAAHEPNGVNRAQASAAIEAAIDRGKKIAQDRSSGQTSLFGLLGDDPAEAKALAQPRGSFPRLDPWDKRDLLAKEKQTLGFYVSGHPLDRYARELRRFASGTTETLGDLGEGAEVVVGGSVEGYRERTTKTGNRIAFFSLEDPVGRVEVIVRPRVLAQDGVREILERGEPVLVTGQVQFERDRGGGGGSDDDDVSKEVKVVMNDLANLAEALKKKTTSVRVRLWAEQTTKPQLEALRRALTDHPGACPVSLELRSRDRWRVALSQTGLSVDPCDALLTDLERLFGRKVAELR